MEKWFHSMMNLLRWISITRLQDKYCISKVKCLMYVKHRPMKFLTVMYTPAITDIEKILLQKKSGSDFLLLPDSFCVGLSTCKTIRAAMLLCTSNCPYARRNDLYSR